MIWSVIFNIERVKKFFKIPILTPHEEREIRESAKSQKNFLVGINEAWKERQLVNEVQERENIREKMFLQAGTHVPQRTYKKSPKDSNPKRNDKIQLKK